MDDNYLDEVLPRWQFLKECLVEQLGQYMESLKETYPEVVKDCAKITNKIEKARTPKSLKRASAELDKFMDSLEKNFRNYNYKGVCEIGVFDERRYVSWLNMRDLNIEINITKTKQR